MTLWSGRFEEEMDETLFALSESFPFDQALFDVDLTASVAHVRGLTRAGLLSEEESMHLSAALEEIRGEFRDHRFQRQTSDEDIHMAIERRATELVGELGQRIHTGRSRNDQVATAMRLYVRGALLETADLTLDFVDVLVQTADRYPGAYLPGYTHLQRAQPVLLAHHLYAHAWALLRDVSRARDAARRLNVSPLGAGALAGTSLPLEPEQTAKELGFDGAFANSLDATSSRDFAAEALFCWAMLGIDLSRMGEELVLWTSAEFNFASLGDAFTTGSSMLPHKKNSDVAELARGKSGRLVGNLTSLLVTLKGLPLAYNRDLQEDKEPVFDSVHQLRLVLVALAGAYRSLQFHEVVAARAAEDPLLVAIDIAEELVREGRPFRQAHEVAGRLVGRAIEESRAFADVVNEEYPGRFGNLFAPGEALRRRSSAGASGPDAHAEQRRRLDVQRLEYRQMLREIGPISPR
ncbi:MAG: argininosuccinate lyase [Acidimicrobiaceae bacterium]|nr:argininosuccinate lyase [Acidimicrobiaceae bacterium]